MPWLGNLPDSSLLSHLLDATIGSIRSSLQRHVPDGNQQDFYLWGISPENPHQKTFLQTMGILQIVNLAAALLEDIVEPKYWQQLSRYVGHVNTYFMYEIVSDDLAIGLSPFAIGDTAFPLRKEILYSFNYVMVDRLQGETTHASELLQPLEHFIRFISGFAQSLTPAKHQDILDAYLSIHPDTDAKAIEYGIWPLLVANIESCYDLNETMKNLHTGTMLRNGFMNRYKAVTALLEDAIMSRDALLDIGTWTILVAPTLTFYVGVVSEAIYPQENFSSVVEDGLLEDAIYTASQLVRLLNDMGGIVMANDHERRDIMDLLNHVYQKAPEQNQTITDLLFNVASQIEIMARIHKDVVHGEFNICLNNLAGQTSVTDALTIFEDNLNYFSHTYIEKRSHLDGLLERITERLGNDKTSTLIARFVQFHQKVYANRYTSSIGEYSI